jgi:hypothetical protein
MTQRSAGQDGWAFLVARGRYRGYRSILVPDFLAASNEYGIVTASVRGDVDPTGAPRVQRITAPETGPMTLVYRTRRMTRADLDHGHRTDDPLTDQHGRPLDLLYGFVSRGAVVHEVDEADLRSARDEALYAYRRFLADEDGSGVQTSRAFTLRSPTGRATRPGRPAPRTTEPQTAPRPRPRLWAALIGVPAVAVVVIAALLWLRPGIDVPATAQCHLDAASRSCTIQVTVRSTGRGALSYAGANLAQPPGTSRVLWTVDDAACRSAADAKTCPITVTVRAPDGAVGQQLTATLTVHLGDPGRTRTVALTATA